MVIVVLDVVLARPGHLDRRAELVRQQRRLGDVIGFRFAAETAAEQGDVDGDLVLVQTERPGRRSAALRVLGRRPNLAAVRRQHGDRRRHFHRGVRQ